jgi:hypothetical protein
VQQKDEHLRLWLDRYEAVGRAQHRYMYLLAVLVVFYSVLALTPSPVTGQPLQIALIGLSVQRWLLWICGPPVIGFTLLAFLGTFSAATVAVEGIEASAPHGLKGDAFDRVPNLIDFAVHTKGNDRKLIRIIAASSYPLFATAVFLSLCWFLLVIATEGELGGLRWLSVVATGSMYPSLYHRLFGWWGSKLRHVVSNKPSMAEDRRPTSHGGASRSRVVLGVSGQAADSTTGIRPSFTYTFEDWQNELHALRDGGDPAPCPRCGRRGFYEPKWAEPNRYYRACKFCGFWQNVGEDPMNVIRYECRAPDHWSADWKVATEAWSCMCGRTFTPDQRVSWPVNDKGHWWNEAPAYGTQADFRKFWSERGLEPGPYGIP